MQRAFSRARSPVTSRSCSHVRNRGSTRISLRASPGEGQELSGTFARCLKFEQEIHHAASKLCILGFEPLE
jgi:hypothetical protein